MSAIPSARLRADLEVILAGYERRALTQARIDAVRDERAREAGLLPLAELVPRPPYGGGLTYGREDVRALTRREALRVLAVVWAGAGVTFALIALGSWLR